ncbi:PEP-CTERM sorting domain-containing protein [Duganella callida]|nr:PEP-CTERM sorting domain-containing protein [Duganella callida]
MNIAKLPRLLILAAGAAWLSSAGATNLVQIDGAHTTFFYDADFWGLGAASVLGDTISLQMRPDMNVSASVRAGSTTATQTQQATDSDSVGIVAVAKTGYSLTTKVGTGLNGSYFTAAKGGDVQVSLGGTIFTGYMENGAFRSQDVVTGSATYFSNASNGSAAQAGSFDVLMYSANPLTYANAIGVDNYLSTYAYQSGSGSSSLSLNAVRYEFSAVAVPEPETYAMLLGGIAVLAGVARRRGGTA